MDEQIGLKLDGEIVKLLDKLESLNPNEEAYHKVSDELKQLYLIRIDGLKAEWDYSEKREKRIVDSGRADEEVRIKEFEGALKRDQFDDQKKDRWIRVSIAGVELILPLVVYAIQFRSGMIFEKTGTFTSDTMKRHLRFLNPFRK